MPEEEAARRQMLSKIASAFELCGFAPLSTPAIEYYEILAGKAGEEGDKLLYRFRDHGHREVALRYDLTVPLARVVAQHRDLLRPFKRYQIGTVWRAEKPAHGRFREFVQCDADIVGASSSVADAECIFAGILALEHLGISRFQIRIGHRGILNALLKQAGIRDEAEQIEVLRTLDKADKVGFEQVTAWLLDLVGEERARTLTQSLLSIRSLKELEALKGEEPEGVEHLTSLFDALLALGVPSDRFRLDLTIARGLDYYTGTVFETTLLDLPEVGSVMSGGRYDGLLTMFGEPNVPAVGLSIGVDRLFSALVELGLLPQVQVGPKAIACPADGAGLKVCLALVSDLRRLGVPCEVVPEPSWRLKKQLQYASRRKARFAIIVGEREAEASKVVLRDLESGSQETVSVSQVHEIVKRE